MFYRLYTNLNNQGRCKKSGPVFYTFPSDSDQQYKEAHSCSILDADNAEGGKVSAHFTEGFLSNGGIGISTFPSVLWVFLLHHQPAQAQSCSNKSSVDGEIYEESQPSWSCVHHRALTELEKWKEKPK